MLLLFLVGQFRPIADSACFKYRCFGHSWFGILKRRISQNGANRRNEPAARASSSKCLAPCGNSAQTIGGLLALRRLDK